MDTILEIKVGGETVRLQTRPTGDVEILTCNTILNSYGGFPPRHTIGGVIDTCIGIIPKSKRAEVAQFLVSA